MITVDLFETLQSVYKMSFLATLMRRRKRSLGSTTCEALMNAIVRVYNVVPSRVVQYRYLLLLYPSHSVYGMCQALLTTLLVDKVRVVWF